MSRGIAGVRREGPHGQGQRRAAVADARRCRRVRPGMHRDVATREEFGYYLREWLKAKYRVKYPLAYLAFHGSEGAISVGDGVDGLRLDELAGLMGARATQRIIYFGCPRGGVAWILQIDRCQGDRRLHEDGRVAGVRSVRRSSHPPPAGDDQHEVGIQSPYKGVPGSRCDAGVADGDQSLGHRPAASSAGYGTARVRGECCEVATPPR